MMASVAGIGVLAHCGANWWACDSASAVAFILFIGGCVIGLKRLERRAEDRAKAHREARAQRMRSPAADEQAPEA